jgi:tetratricopeptide (TPR) repeat protein
MEISNRQTGRTPSWSPSPRKALWAAVSLSLVWAGAAVAFVFRAGANPPTLAAAPADTETIVALPPGKITVQTDPEGAVLFLNDRFVGASPLTLRGLRSGWYALRVEREGRETVRRQIKVTGRPEENEIVLQLPLARGGKVSVDLAPVGAEIWLDGALEGFTPAEIDNVPLGPHELVVRKTNFEPWARTFHLSAAGPVVFKGESLTDKILVGLTGLTVAEPDNVAHWSDLGRYHFLNNRPEEAAEAFVRALNAAVQSPAIPDNVPDEDRRMLVQQHQKNVEKMRKDLGQIRGWQARGAVVFFEGLNAALERECEKHLDDWNWVRNAAESMDRIRTESIYRKFIAASLQNAEKSIAALRQAYVALLRVVVTKPEPESLADLVDEYIKNCNPPAMDLQNVAYAFYERNRRPTTPRRDNDLALAELMLTRAVRLAREGKQQDVLSLCLFDGATVAVLRNQKKSAVPLFQEAVETCRQETTKERYKMSLADCLWEINEKDDAAKIYLELANAKNPEVRAAAQNKVRDLKLSVPETPPPSKYP